MRLWVLSTCIPRDLWPCFPQVFLSQDAAEDAAERNVLFEWVVESDGPLPLDYFATKRRARPVVDWRTMQKMIMSNDGEGRYGAWEITEHHLPVMPIA